MMIVNAKEKSGRVGVIGGGLGGLAAACTLGARGYDVVVLERNDWVGGKAAILEADGFRFDMGPTIFLMPSVIARIFAEAGRDYRECLDLIPLDPQWRSFFDDGSTLDLCRGREEMIATLEKFSPWNGLGDDYGRFLDLADTLRSISDRFFFYRSVGSIKDMFDLKTAFHISMLADVLKMRPWSTVAATIRSFIDDERRPECRKSRVR